MINALPRLIRDPRFFRALPLGFVAGILVWEVISRSLAASLAAAAPERALWLDPNQPDALTRLADRGLAVLRGQTPGAYASGAAGAPVARPAVSSIEANPGAAPSTFPQPPGTAEDTATLAGETRSFAERAFEAAPLNSRPLCILAELAERSGDSTRAGHLFEASAARSLREGEADLWLLRHDVAERDYGKALYYADTLLRTRPAAIRLVGPVLSALAETREASGAVKTLLLANPPWRTAFFSALPNWVTDARTPLDLLLSLKESGTPPTAAELKTYLNFLIDRNFHELAYYTWLQFLSPEQLASVGLLYNGNFETRPSGLPFDWVIDTGPGTTVDIVTLPSAGGQRGLNIRFGNGRVHFGGVSQWLMLPPGAYRLEGKYKGEITGPRGLKWRLACDRNTSVFLAETPMMLGRFPAWKEFNLPFIVPDAGCRAQLLRLDLDARSASEQLASGSMWYEQLKILRDSSAAPASSSDLRQGGEDVPAGQAQQQ